MPKRVDHEERRREITEAVWRIATAEGLAAVTLRRVAAEAGISMNLVQYYFTSKEKMIRYGLERVIEVAVARMSAELEAVRESGDSRAVVRAAIVGMLPVDDVTRHTSAVYYAYLLHAITDEEIRSIVSGIPRQLAPRLAHRVPGADPLVELESLIALASGLAVGVLVGSYTAEEAVAFVDHRLDRLYA
ncbi:TetR/AcrR family transcriptional regulator [Lentzea xinjiangensis]|uniref:TetR/AcrR family transcriptional regulator n=1 Tax=Lentzea xinjiangensis TaxID=402600 RepID=UPI0015A60801|nr:TetR family transcriptional regulator C-terminal domain-containing protein [Lentzea xinjiangensis]